MIFNFNHFLKDKNIKSIDDFLDFVNKLPYGRNSDRNNIDLVLIENKGTCSSKHALIKKYEDFFSVSDIKLILCIFKMNGINTPKIKEILNKYNIEYIPEAHTYLKINSIDYDLTFPNSNKLLVKDYILFEKEISYEYIKEDKVNFHKNYLKNWIKSNKINFYFEEIWEIREECIAKLSI